MHLREVNVLMGTYNGARYLAEQLDSLGAQRGAAVRLLISDDGSTDATISMAKARMRSAGLASVKTIEGPRKGFAENYRHLALQCDDGAEFYAFSDQDDIWEADKLQTAISWFEHLEPGVPGLFCSRTTNIDGNDRITGLSREFIRPPVFRNAIVQSIAGANTMVLNRAGFRLLRESCRRTSFVSHDWWAYMIVSGCGGRVHYAARPLVRYRQHAANLVGANNTWRARMHRIAFAMTGRFSEWTSRNLAGLEACRDMLTDDARMVLDNFKGVRGPGIGTRLRSLARSGAYRQTRLGQASLVAACALRIL